MSAGRLTGVFKCELTHPDRSVHMIFSFFASYHDLFLPQCETTGCAPLSRKFPDNKLHYLNIFSLSDSFKPRSREGVGKKCLLPSTCQFLLWWPLPSHRNLLHTYTLCMISIYHIALPQSSLTS